MDKTLDMKILTLTTKRWKYIIKMYLILFNYFVFKHILKIKFYYFAALNFWGRMILTSKKRESNSYFQWITLVQRVSRQGGVSKQG